MPLAGNSGCNGAKCRHYAFNPVAKLHEPSLQRRERRLTVLYHTQRLDGKELGNRVPLIAAVRLMALKPRAESIALTASEHDLALPSFLLLRSIFIFVVTDIRVQGLRLRLLPCIRKHRIFLSLVCVLKECLPRILITH